jgi:hypothetical protein
MNSSVTRRPRSSASSCSGWARASTAFSAGRCQNPRGATLTAAYGMHGRGVIHRYIKSENILVVDGLRLVKLREFGMATSTSDLPPYEPAGTPAYREIPVRRSRSPAERGGRPGGPPRARRGRGSCSRRSL